MLSHHELESKIHDFHDVLDSIDTAKIQTEIDELEKQSETPGFWDNPKKAGEINQNLAHKIETIKSLDIIKSEIQDLQAAHDLGDEDEFRTTLKMLENKIETIERENYLNGQWDDSNCLVTIQSGAGGVDAMDFAAMLMHMYQGFAKHQEWDCSIINISSGDEGGVKSATMFVSGLFAYGLMKEEAGVHRLVRLSPFNSGNTRETSFASVEVMPEGLDEHLEVEVNDDDIRMDTFMSSGKGGQSVNTTYSAVRLTHIPTGLSTTCQNERSQIQNKDFAMKMLKSKLAAKAMEEQKDNIDSMRHIKGSADFGSQIRSYVMHPYKQVKDHRSKHEEKDVDKVLNGELILDFIWSVKKQQIWPN